jgi:hypothetical protein
VSSEERYKYRYRFLASADIVGSTAFKSRQAREKEEWAHVFRNFFDEFPKRLHAEYEKLCPDTVPECKPLDCLQIWKFVGDEILFSVELTRHEEAVYHVLSMKRALNKYSDELAKKYPGLGLKGTIWGAGFPVMNVEVLTNTNDSSVSDYLGPSVDLGFRLTTYSDLRRIPVSADIAYFLLTAHSNSSSEARDGLKLFVDPPQILKGINLGRTYPIIWLDRKDGEQTPEDAVLERSRTPNHSAIIDYLDHLFEGTVEDIRRPFIVSDPDGRMKRIPEEIERWREKLMASDPEQQWEQEDPSQDRDPDGPAHDPPLPDSRDLN